MHRTTRRSVLLSFSGFLGATLLSGCALGPAEEGDELIGAAEQRQLIPTHSSLDWRKFTLRHSSSTGNELAVVFVMTNTVNSFNAGTEYWYVDQAILGSLSANNIYISYTDGSGSPSTPSYSNMQSFSVAGSPVGGWGAGWTSDPHSGLGKLYQNGSYSLRLQTSGSGSSTTVTAVAWYQVIPMADTPANILPSATFSYNSGGTVAVATNYRGYAINQTP